MVFDKEGARWLTFHSWLSSVYGNVKNTFPVIGISLVVIGLIITGFAAVYLVYPESISNQERATLQKLNQQIESIEIKAAAYDVETLDIGDELSEVRGLFSLQEALISDLKIKAEEVQEEKFKVETFGDALYFSAVTYFTIGFGDIVPVNENLRSVVVIQAVTSFFFNLVAGGMILSILIQPINYLKVSQNVIINQARLDERQHGYEVLCRVCGLNRKKWLHNMSVLFQISEAGNDDCKDWNTKINKQYDRLLFRGVNTIKFCINEPDEVEYLDRVISDIKKVREHYASVGIITSREKETDGDTYNAIAKELQIINRSINIYVVASDEKGGNVMRTQVTHPKDFVNRIHFQKQYVDIVSYSNKNGKLSDDRVESYRGFNLVEPLKKA